MNSFFLANLFGILTVCASILALCAFQDYLLRLTKKDRILENKIKPIRSIRPGWLMGILVFDIFIAWQSSHPEIPSIVAAIQFTFPFLIFSCPCILLYTLNAKTNTRLNVIIFIALFFAYFMCFGAIKLDASHFPPRDIDSSYSRMSQYYQITHYRVSVGMMSVAFWHAVVIALRSLKACSNPIAEQNDLNKDAGTGNSSFIDAAIQHCDD
jgi:hypothetical protein